MKTYVLKPPTDFYGKPLPMFKSGGSNDHDKAVDQLVGICAGILSDGVVNAKEAEFFNQWLRTHAPLEPAFFASQKWANTSFGRKIERAVELRESGSGIAIISEEHWKTFL